MPEDSDQQILLNRILDHLDDQGLDQEDRLIEGARLAGKSYEELAAEYPNLVDA